MSEGIRAFSQCPAENDGSNDTSAVIYTPVEAGERPSTFKEAQNGWVANSRPFKLGTEKNPGSTSGLFVTHHPVFLRVLEKACGRLNNSPQRYADLNPQNL